MTYESIYCDATHDASPDGCYEPPNHTGQHRGIVDGESFHTFYWSDQADQFTEADLCILLTALKGAEHFFPGLVAKIERMREAAQ